MSVRLEKTKEYNSRGELVQHFLIDDKIWMSNSDDEYADIERSLKDARGDCFIGGLGMGLIAQECAKKDDVQTVLVVEKNQEVAEFVAEQILKLEQWPINDGYWMHEDSKIVVMLGDARKDFDTYYEYEPSYDWMYLDTYDEPSEVAYYEHVLPFIKNAKKALKNKGIIDYWCKPRFDNKEVML